VNVAPYHPEGKNDHKLWPTLTQYLLNMLDRHTEADYLTPRVFRRACRWLEENRDNAPWLLWIDSFAPHERWDPPMEFADAYYRAAGSRNYIQPQLINNKPDITEDEIRRTRALYWGYVTFVDKWIGVFCDKLRQMHLLDETVVIFTSDHGTELWDKGRFGKGGDRLYAYNTRVPLLVRLPGARHASTKRHDLCQHQDLMPTICSLMGCGTSDLALDGRDLFDPAAADAEPQKVIIAWGPNVSVRDHTWNLVIDSTQQTDRKALYDLTADAEERENVYDGNPAVAAEMVGFLEDTLGPLPYEIKHTGDRRQAPPLIVRYR
jgi:arylsulfatase A-like enzyme